MGDKKKKKKKEIPAGAGSTVRCKPLSKPAQPSSDETGCCSRTLGKIVGFHGGLENHFLQLVYWDSPLRA